MTSRAMRVVLSIVESLIRPIGGGVGQRLRYLYYSRRFHACGSNVRIDEGVIIQNPESIEVGNDVWFLSYSVITGRGQDAIPANRVLRVRGAEGRAETRTPTDAMLRIGDQTSIGLYNIIHGYGGLTIGKRVTTSARVSVYSFSHVPNDTSDPGLITYANSMVRDAPVACIVSPITLEDGVWLGLGSVVFGGTIGANSFVAAQSVVIGDLEPNSYAAGNPATRVRARFQGL
jgi:acetyltransferase-like isoleucine patch superfamily enzyme